MAIIGNIPYFQTNPVVFQAMGSEFRYPLVMTNIAMERSTIFNGKIHYFDWAIFNSNVSLPEGMFNRNSNIIISRYQQHHQHQRHPKKVPVQFPPSSHFQMCQGAIFALAFAFATFTTFAFALLRLIHGGRQHGTYEQVLASFVWPQEKLLQLAVSSSNSQSIGYWWDIYYWWDT